KDVLALDVTDAYWNFGLRLFKDNSNPPPISTAFGDLTSDEFFLPGRSPSLPSNPSIGTQFLDRKVDYAYAGAVLHVLSEDAVKALLSKLFEILAPSGILFGTCVGVSGTETPVSWWTTPDGKGTPRALHSTASLSSLARAIGFAEVSVKSMELSNMEQREGRMRGDPAEMDRDQSEMRALGVERAYLSFEFTK
ncbi:hypothetical protein HDU93_003837, partial [Gonapodya sp. JEL0774]